jgi:glycerophosphoryl diester phosphodiesterase
VNVFWADTPADMWTFISMGVDGLLTNQPRVLQKVLAGEPV